MVCIVKIKEEKETSQKEMTVDYGFKIVPGQKFFTGNFLERVLWPCNKQLDL